MRFLKSLLFYFGGKCTSKKLIVNRKFYFFNCINL
jgi:hypothetical protein